MNNHAIYGRYKKIRDIVWKIYINLKISSLPVSVMDICKKLNIIVLSYEKGMKDDLFITTILIQKELKMGSFCLHDTETNKWYIFYDPKIIPREAIKLYLAHELGHIILDHETEKMNVRLRVISFSPRNLIQNWEEVFEKDAFMFAVRLLCPVGVMAALNIQSAEDIQYICRLPKKFAVERFKRLKELYIKNVFGKSKLEKQVLEQFQDFIKNYPENKY